MKIPHIPCEEAAVNVEKSLWQKLILIDWLKTRWHMVLCKKCQKYEQDSKVLHQILCTLLKKQKVASLNQEEKEKLKRAIEKR